MVNTTYTHKTKLKPWLTMAALAVAQVASAATVGWMAGFHTNEWDVTEPNVIESPLMGNFDSELYPNQWWANMVEEAAFANINFIALACSVDSDNQKGPGGTPSFRSPTKVWRGPDAATARGYGTLVKFALMDDTAVYPHAYADDSGQPPNMNLADTNNWHYWWDNNWAVYFDKIPDAYRQKIQGRPLVVIWGVYNYNPANPSLGGFSNIAGNLSPLIDYLRGQCATLGFDPFIVVDKSWVNFEPAVLSHVDGVNDWFEPSLNQSWSKRTVTARSGTFTTGLLVPGFKSSAGYIARNYGNTFLAGMNGTNGSDLVLIENQNNSGENAAMYRAATDMPSPAGSPAAGDRWIYPNHYLNALRHYTAPFPKFVIYEAEGCDSFDAPSSPSSGGLFRRKGNLNIAYTDGSQQNWAVELNANEWVQYEGFEMGGSSNYSVGVRYSSVDGATAEFLVDDVTVASFSLPATGSLDSYSQASQGTFSIAAGNRYLKLKITSGTARVDNFSLNGL